MASLRTLLVLGRVSNLPTVWTNCLAGWLLGGGGDWTRFAWLCAGATLVYVGGMFLNDAFDAEFDAQGRLVAGPAAKVSAGAYQATEGALTGTLRARVLPALDSASGN